MICLRPMAVTPAYSRRAKSILSYYKEGDNKIIF